MDRSLTHPTQGRMKEYCSHVLIREDRKNSSLFLSPVGDGEFECPPQKPFEI